MGAVTRDKLASLTILSGETASGWQKTNEADAITIYGPSALTGTVTVEVRVDDNGDAITLTSGGTNVTVAAAKAVVISPPAFDAFRLKSGSAEGSDRTFVLTRDLGVR